MTKFLSNILLLIVALFLSACAAHQIDPDNAGRLKGFKKELVKGGDFWITTYQKISNPDLPYVFYLEGDGAAFDGRYKVSKNPTPRSHMLFSLATMDPRPNVVYVARPCQYTPMNLNSRCNPSYWTNKRMSDDSVRALDEVINSINRHHNYKFDLIGYSGGGGIVVLLAARNDKVKNIITIAGNLDHAAFTHYHNVPPMIGSLNPIDYATKVRNIPQLHISGGKDKIVPPFIADKFVQAAGSNCVKQLIMPKINHYHGWDSIWSYVLSQPLTCQ